MTNRGALNSIYRRQRPYMSERETRSIVQDAEGLLDMDADVTYGPGAGIVQQPRRFARQVLLDQGRRGFNRHILWVAVFILLLLFRVTSYPTPVTMPFLVLFAGLAHIYAIELFHVPFDTMLAVGIRRFLGTAGILLAACCGLTLRTTWPVIDYIIAHVRGMNPTMDALPANQAEVIRLVSLMENCINGMGLGLLIALTGFGLAPRSKAHFALFIPYATLVLMHRATFVLADLQAVGPWYLCEWWLLLLGSCIMSLLAIAVYTVCRRWKGVPQVSAHGDNT